MCLWLGVIGAEVWRRWRKKEKKKKEEGGGDRKAASLSSSFPLFKEETRALLTYPSPTHALPEDHRHAAMVFGTKTHFP